MKNNIISYKEVKRIKIRVFVRRTNDIVALLQFKLLFQSFNDSSRLDNLSAISVNLDITSLVAIPYRFS